MENINSAIKSVLGEIIETGATGDSVFNVYKDKKTIGVEIFKELYKRFDFNKKGFVLNDTSNDVGLLSQCQCLQALVSLALDFNLQFDSNEIIPGQKNTIREMMDFVIEDILDRVIIKDEAGNVVGFKFDASPYDTVHYTSEISNIDTITWVIPSFFIILKYHANLERPEICKWEDDIVAVIKHGIRYINEAFINSDETEGKISIGWNFTKKCEEPSLYFSYAVSECYLDIFTTFEDILKYVYAKRNERLYGIEVDEELKNTYDEKLTEYEENLKKEVKDKKYAKHDTYNELVRIFKRINDIGEFEEIHVDNTLYGDLEKNCRTVALRVWEHVNKDLADKFFYNDLKTTLSEQDILTSTTSDALFNTVYIVNIMIDGGLDKHLDILKNAALLEGDVQKAEDYQREYDNLLESCQLAVQKAFRTYESLKNKSKDYIVDQFLIGFNEKFVEHKALVNELRKLRMKTFSLLPMLIHTNNVISEYLIKYPQYNMKKYLEYIVENRYVSSVDNKAHWIWEKDGYFSGSNCYYIVALNEFYVYHEKYERDYIDIGKRNASQKQRIIEEHNKQLKGPGGQIFELEKEKEEQEKEIEKNKLEIARLEQEIKEVKRPVEDAVRTIINEEFDKRFASLLQQTLAHAAKAITLDRIDETPDDENVYSGICSSLYDMIFAEIFAGYYKVGNSYRFDDVDDYRKKANDFRVDLKATIAAYISSINGYVGADEDEEKKSFLRRWLDKN